MSLKSNAQILDAAVAGRIPPTTDLSPRILARIGGKNGAAMQPKLKFATILLIVALAALALSTAAYAIYRWMGDAGLQSVQDAGLVTDLGASAQATLYPTATLAMTPQPATGLGLSQSIGGATLTLDWIYLDQSRLALGMHPQGLPDGASLGAAQVTFAGLTPRQAQGWSQVQRTPGGQAIYVSYQVIQAAAVGGKVDLGVDVPLLSGPTEGQAAQGTFHFDLPAVPVFAGQSLPFQQTHAVQRNGVEVRLESVRVTPTLVEVVACTAAPDWSVKQATLQLGDGPEEGYQTLQALDGPAAAGCVRLGFAPGNLQGVTRLIFRVRELAAGSSVQPAPPAGAWEFFVDLPATDAIPGLAAPTPTATPAAVGEQTLAGVTMTLDWVFVDAKRVAFGYTIAGLPDAPSATQLNGQILVQDGQGNLVGGGFGGSSPVERVEGKPGVLQGVWSSILRDALTQPEIDLSIDATLGGGTGSDPNQVIAYMDLAPGAPVPTPGPPASFPDRLIGTFHFDAHAPIYPLQVLGPQPAVTANGVSLQIQRAEITPSYASFVLCYAKPSSRDWTIGGPALLQAGGYQAQIKGYRLLLDPDYGGYVAKGTPDPGLSAISGMRCVLIDFLLGHSTSAQSLTLTIPALEQSMPEVIPPDELRAAQTKLGAQGIEMEYSVSSSASGGGGSGQQFTRKPEGMSDEEAYQRFMQALGYLHPGPWTFTLDLQP